MHNWHLLLFALLAFLHSIVCFSEHSLVDGREQCCGRNNLLRDTRHSITFLIQKPSEDYRLNSRVGIREDRRYEVRRDVSEHTTLAANTKRVGFRAQREANGNSREIADRLLPQVRLVNDRRERTLPALEPRLRRFSPDFRRIASNDISRDGRIQDIVQHRNSRDSDIRLQERVNREFKRFSHVSRNGMVRNSRDEARHTASFDSRRDHQRIRDREGATEFHSRDNRLRSRERTRTDTSRSETSKDRREVRQRLDERSEFRLRSHSPFQRDTYQEYPERSLEREMSDSRENRRWTLASRNADRIRSVRHETSSRLREDVREKWQRVDSRRVSTERLSEHRQSLDENNEFQGPPQRERRERIVRSNRVSRERTLQERHSSRNSVDRVRSLDNMATRLEHVVGRRDSRADKRVYNSEHTAVSQNHRLENKRIMNREIREQENIPSRKDRRSLDRTEIRDMKREARSRFTGERDTTSIEQRALKNYMERSDMDSSLRTNEFRRKLEYFTSTIREKTQQSEKSTVLNWQYLFYTLQGVYVCGLLIQIMSEKASKKKSRYFSMWPVNHSQIKVD